MIILLPSGSTNIFYAAPPVSPETVSSLTVHGGRVQFPTVAFIGVYSVGAYWVDRMSVVVAHIFHQVHVVIYINKLFSAEARRKLLQVTRLGLFLMTWSLV